ncbi:hypothetical protein ACJJI5_14070 [Microbulbifer sp. EKSA008]|uniref:hypothetical protein n=1 Tax=Microbulbifer sp. EKSA008 TaxID=3243367 RepID=UPI0040410696
MKRVLILLIVIECSLLGCASKVQKYPEVEEEELSPAVIVAVPLKGRYLQQFEECTKENVICLDPPPQVISYVVIDQIFGEELPQRIEVATTGHFGLQSFDFRSHKPEIILIGSQSNSHILPRYHRMPLAKLINGDLAIPVYEKEDLWWFPCSIYEQIRPLKYQEKDRELAIPLEDTYPKIQESKYVRLEGGFYFPTHGVPISSLKTYLETNKFEFREFKCESV